MSEQMELIVDDAPALIVTTGRGEAFIFADNGLPEPEVSGLAAAVLVTRLRWWADRIAEKAARADLERQYGIRAVTEDKPA